MPSTTPGSVSASPTADCAMPKSVTFTLPPGVSSTLLGFTSRWTTPWWWACASASAICAPTAATSAGGNGPRSLSSARRLRPSTNSITMKGSVPPPQS